MVSSLMCEKMKVKREKKRRSLYQDFEARRVVDKYSGLHLDRLYIPNLHLFFLRVGLARTNLTIGNGTVASCHKMGSSNPPTRRPSPGIGSGRVERLHIEHLLLPASVPIRPAGVNAANPRQGGNPREGLIKDDESCSLVYEKTMYCFGEFQ